MLEEFRNLWYDEYLLSLREQWKDLHEVNFVNRLKPDDIVLVKGPPDKKRPYWQLGRVLEVIPGDDGKVRSAKLQRADGHIAHHSLNHLYPMELALTHDHVAKAPDHSQDQQSSEIPTPAQFNEVRGETDLGGSGVQSILPDYVESQVVVPSNNVLPDDFQNQVVVSPDNVLPDNVASQVSVSPDIEYSSTQAEVHIEPSIEASIEEVGDNAVSDVGSLLANDQVIDHFSHTENLIPRQDLDLVNNSMGEYFYPLSRRPRRKAALKGRPLDDQFEYY